jgi:transposase
MYKVLDKNTIKEEILPYLSTGKRGFKITYKLEEVVNAILYKMKTGCQWAYLPVRELFSEVVPSYQSVFYHFRKWCKNGDWKSCWISLLNKNKSMLDLSSGDIDGSHTTALRGGEAVAYQGRKKRKTTNALYLTDRQGLPLALSTPKAGNHHDLHEITTSLDELFALLKQADISLDGLFINADSGFDSGKFRLACLEKGITANVAFNHRNGDNNEQEYLLDEALYKERYSIGRTNAWMDSYRSLLNRFDVTVSSWKCFNYIAFMVILFKKIKNP